MPTPSGEKKQLTTLVEVSQALASTLHLKDALHHVLELLERQHAMFPSIVTLSRGEGGGGELTIAAAHGLTSRGKQTCRSRISVTVEKAEFRRGKFTLRPVHNDDADHRLPATSGSDPTRVAELLVGLVHPSPATGESASGDSRPSRIGEHGEDAARPTR